MRTLQIILVCYACFSALTFVVYAIDKRAARLGRRRVPERRLHLLALLGGWPGAWLGMSLLRHKRRKGPFVRVTFAITLAHVALLVWLVARADG